MTQLPISQNLSQQDLISLLIGLTDSDGCLSWTWSLDNALIPSIDVTQRKNHKLLTWLHNQLQIGSFSEKRQSWCLKNQKQLLKYFAVWFYSTDLTNQIDLKNCRLQTSKRLDSHFMIFVLKEIQRKNQRSEAGRAFLIGLRSYLHWGIHPVYTKSVSQLCNQLKVSPQVYNHCHSDVLNAERQAKTEYVTFQQTIFQNLATQQFLQQNYLLDGWQTVGFFLGDGGMHVIWGTRMITCTINWTGDSESAHALEFYAASTLRDGIYRKAWKSKNRNVSRLIVHNVELIEKRIIPFFTKYPIPPCFKQEIVQKICETAIILNALKKKKNWSTTDEKNLRQIINQTWNLNPSGPNRKFLNPDDYCDHVLLMKNQQKLQIR